MKKSISVLFCLLPFFLIAQTEPQTGIKFQDLDGWTNVQAKAKQENKYIFIDFYATWCGPCKSMDKNIYPLDSIGNFVNEHFLSIKVQIDSTAGDNEQVKKWYTDARHLASEYKIKSLPTFLFFTPDGKLVHKDIGYQPSPAFMALVHNALNPEKQYFAMLDAFRQGKLSYPNTFNLAEMSRAFGENEIANAASKKYIDDYLLKQDEKSLYTPQNLLFMATFMSGSQDKAFQFFYNHIDKIDGAMKTKGYAWNTLDPIIEREEINAHIYTDGKPFHSITETPDWNALYAKIKDKYSPGYADRVVLWAKVKWLEHKKEWAEYTKHVIRRVEKYGPYIKIFPYTSVSASDLQAWNYCAWEVFTYSNDKDDLKTALSWSEKVVTSDSSHDANFTDTYANILYKMGRLSEALPIEEKAFATAQPALAKGIGENLEKMKKGEPTWSTK